jgi:TRAP-type mannitol/chloroaromatic compound transport system permease small subunit
MNHQKSKITRVLQIIISIVDTLNELVGRTVSWLTLGMVCITFMVVILRYGFDAGWIAMQESVTYFHALTFMAGAAYTLKYDGHVRVDIFYRDMASHTQAWINILGALFLLLPVCLYILWTSWDYVYTSWILLEGSRESGGLPLVFVLKSCIPLMACLLLLQGLSQISHNLLAIIEHNYKQDTNPQ